MAAGYDINQATGAVSRARGFLGFTLAACLLTHPMTARADPDPLPVDTQTSPATSQYEQQKAAFEAQKAAIEAETAQLQAELAQTKLKFSGGLAAPTPPPNAITLGSDPGKAEVTLLHARALKAAGDDISRQICPKVSASGPTLILVGDQQIDLSHFLAFKADTGSLDAQLTAARSSLDDANRQARSLPPANTQADNARSAMTVLAGADALLGSAAKLASYFNAKYTFGGATPDKDPALLSAAISCDNARFIIPGNVPASSKAQAFTTLANLEANASAVRLRLAAARNAANRLAERSDKQAQAVSAKLTSVIQDASATLSRFDAFATALGALTPVEGKPAGPAPIALIAREEFIDAALTQPGAQILALRPVSAGAYYTKESLWSFLAGPPLKVMGGAAVAYSLQDATTGIVAKSGTVIFHGGYRSVRAVEKLFPKIN